MFKLLVKMLILILCVTLCVPVVSAYEEEVTLYVNGERIYTDVPAILENGRTLIPIRGVFENLGATVDWDEGTEQVIIRNDDTRIIFKIGNNIAFVGSSIVKLDVSPVIKDGRTLVPVRFVSETLGYDVYWDDATRSVYIEPSEQIVNKMEINSISVNSHENVVVTIKADNFHEPVISTADSPLRYILDFENAQLQSVSSQIPVYKKGVKEVRYAQHPGYTRVVIEATGNADFIPRFFSDGYMTVEVIERESYPQNNYTEQPYVPETSQPTASKNEANFNGGPVVVIDAGHGGSDTGAIGYDAYGREAIRESVTNLKIALGVQKYLIQNGVNVIMTRTTDTKIANSSTMDDLTARAEIANNAGAALFVSVHNNAFTSSDASGTLVLYADTENKVYNGVSSKTLAQNILRPLVKTMGLLDRGVVDSPKMVVLYKTNMPAVIIECGFVTSPKDRELLLNDYSLDNISRAIADGIIKTLSQIR